MIERTQYLKALRTYRDVPLVKILAGIRRCGKSTILEMLRADLLKDGIREDHVIFMRCTSEELDEDLKAKDMYKGIKACMTDGGRYYLLAKSQHTSPDDISPSLSINFPLQNILNSRRISAEEYFASVSNTERVSSVSFPSCSLPGKGQTTVKNVTFVQELV